MLECEICHKKYMGQAKLDEHKAKKHVAGAVEQPVAESPKEQETVETQPTVTTVVIKSADNRDLEVSIGNNFWKGKVIEVPSEQAEDVRRLLTVGGYYLKD